MKATFVTWVPYPASGAFLSGKSFSMYEVTKPTTEIPETSTTSYMLKETNTPLARYGTLLKDLYYYHYYCYFDNALLIHCRFTPQNFTKFPSQLGRTQFRRGEKGGIIWIESTNLEQKLTPLASQFQFHEI